MCVCVRVWCVVGVVGGGRGHGAASEHGWRPVRSAARMGVQQVRGVAGAASGRLSPPAVCSTAGRCLREHSSCRMSQVGAGIQIEALVKLRPRCRVPPNGMHACMCADHQPSICCASGPLSPRWVWPFAAAPTHLRKVDDLLPRRGVPHHVLFKARGQRLGRRLKRQQRHLCMGMATRGGRSRGQAWWPCCPSGRAARTC